MIAGNALIGQSGGPTSVINASLCGVIEQAVAGAAIEKIFGMRWGIEGFLKGDVLDLGIEAQATIQGLKTTPSSILGSCRYKLADSDLPGILTLLKRLDIRYFFMIGGNDTMDTIHRIEAFCQKEGYDLAGVGIPKTVDNDLYGTDYTPGFPSAARYVALSVKQAGRLARDMQKVDRYVVHQTVGREAGWLAASSALARDKEGDAPHLVLIPERPLSQISFLSAVETCIKKYGYVSIVCGEGIVWEDGTPVSASQDRDKFSNIEFGAMGGGSAALNLHRLIKDKFGFRGEFQITESLSMCAIDRASRLDLEEACLAGARAVDYATSGLSGVMVTLVRSAHKARSDFGSIALADVAVRAKPMPDHFIAVNGMDVTGAFLEYAKPLVGSLGEFVELDYHNVTV